MKLLIDAQLPPRLATFLTAHGHDAVHVGSLPHGVRATDSEIATYADAQARIMVTKDADFRHSHTVVGTPAQLLIVATGNISNADLLAIVASRLEELEAGFASANLVELHRDVLIVHGKG